MGNSVRALLIPALLGILAGPHLTARAPQLERPVLVGQGDEVDASQWPSPKSQPKTAADTDCWVTAASNPDYAPDPDVFSGSDLKLDVTVVNLEALLQWASSSNVAGTSARQAAVGDVVLYLNGTEVRNLHPMREQSGDVTHRVLMLNGKRFRVIQRILHFHFDRAPLSSAWPQGIVEPVPDKWDAVKMIVSVGLPKLKSVRSESLDPNDNPASPITVDMRPRWRPSDRIPEYASELDAWVNGFIVDGSSYVSPIPPTYGLGQSIVIQFNNPQAYIQWATSKDKTKTQDRTVANLVLFVDGHPIPGLHPGSLGQPSDTPARSQNRQLIVPAQQLEFRLKRTLESNEAWSALLNRPSFTRDVAVSIGFEDLAPAITNILPRQNDLVPMRLQIIPVNLWSVIGAILVVASFVLFFVLAAKSDLIRDTGAPARADGWKPFSLARTQMAFWFFLVFSTYFFIFVVTGDKDTIPVSVLGLIGVSAATAVGSALVDAAARRDDDSRLTIVGPSTPIASRREEVKRLEVEQSNLSAELAAGGDDSTKQEHLKTIRRALRSIRRSSVEKFAFDLLAENETIAFHRFQICVWTLLLGIIFMKDVWDKLAMPEFSTTLVGLMGISSGTYVALKERPAGK